VVRPDWRSSPGTEAVVQRTERTSTSSRDHRSCSNWPITFGVGLGDRAELFGALTAVRRIDRDLRPIFIPTQPAAGGVVNDYPFVRQGWSDNQLGDFWLGAKVNLISQWEQDPAAFAFRGLIKLPTAKDDEEGVGTGKIDFALDAILSGEVNERVELSGFAGVIFRGDPDDAELSNGLRWGFGIGTPSRRSLRLTAELHGERLRRRGHAVAVAGRRRSVRRAADLGDSLAPERVHRPHVAAQRRVFRWSRAELADQSRRAQRVWHVRGRDG
jgi:hypothetical protein